MVAEGHKFGTNSPLVTGMMTGNQLQDAVIERSLVVIAHRTATQNASSTFQHPYLREIFTTLTGRRHTTRLASLPVLDNGE